MDAPSFPNAEILKQTLGLTRGSLRTNVPLAPLSRLKVGGNAEVFFRPKDLDDLATVLGRLPSQTPLTFLGGGSNVLIRDGGIPGLTIRLGAAFGNIQCLEERKTDALFCIGASVSCPTLAKRLSESGFSGAAFLSGIPGHIGGAIRMNAGAFGQEIQDILVKAFGFYPDGSPWEATLAEMDYGYRHCGISQNILFTHAHFRFEHGDTTALLTHLQYIQEQRQKNQPFLEKTAGSTFANPPGKKAWQLIQSVGGQTLSVGDATFSPLHANFLINKGKASAQDLESLAEEVRRRIKQTHNIDLRWEVRRLGLPLSSQ